SQHRFDLTWFTFNDGASATDSGFFDVLESLSVNQHGISNVLNLLDMADRIAIRRSVLAIMASSRRDRRAAVFRRQSVVEYRVSHTYATVIISLRILVCIWMNLILLLGGDIE